MWEMVDCANVFKSWGPSRSSSESFSLYTSIHAVADRTVTTWKRLKIKCAGLFLLCQWPWRKTESAGRTWFPAYSENLVLSGQPDWCWYFYCRSLTAHCYLCCLWFCDRSLRLNAPHGRRRRAEGCGSGWSTEGRYTLAQIFGDLAESQGPLSFTPVTCSLTGVHQMLQAACTVPCISSSKDVLSTSEQRVELFPCC